MLFKELKFVRYKAQGRDEWVNAWTRSQLMLDPANHKVYRVYYDVETQGYSFDEQHVEHDGKWWSIKDDGDGELDVLEIACLIAPLVPYRKVPTKVTEET